MVLRSVKQNNVDEYNQRINSELEEYILELKKKYNSLVNDLDTLYKEYTKIIPIFVSKKVSMNKKIKEVKKDIQELSLRINALESQL
mgnify:CR=1 FL=1